MSKDLWKYEDRYPLFNVVGLVMPVVGLCKINHMDSHRGDWDGGDGLIGSEGAPGIYYSSFPDDTDTKPDLGITALP